MVAAETVQIVGSLGATLVLIAWLLETIELMQRHKTLLDLRFSAMALCGSVLLAMYSAFAVFAIGLWLNVGLSTIIIMEIVYSLRVKKLHKKRHRKR